MNTYIHMLPGRRKSARVTLKNGVGKSTLLEWYLQSMSEKFSRKNVTITLLDEKLKPVMVWDLTDAYPVKWSGPQLKTDQNAVAIQTLDLACGEISVKFS